MYPIFIEIVFAAPWNTSKIQLPACEGLHFCLRSEVYYFGVCSGVSLRSRNGAVTLLSPSAAESGRSPERHHRVPGGSRLQGAGHHRHLPAADGAGQAQGRWCSQYNRTGTALICGSRRNGEVYKLLVFESVKLE